MTVLFDPKDEHIDVEAIEEEPTHLGDFIEDDLRVHVAYDFARMKHRRAFAEMVEMVQAISARNAEITQKSKQAAEFYGCSAIYALRSCTEEIAREIASGYNDPRPVRPVAYRERKRPAIEHYDDHEDGPPL
jgi:hypothetical protein